MLTLDEMTEMVTDCHAAGFITDAAAVDVLAEAAGLCRGLAAALLIADRADRDDWTPLRDWTGGWSL